MHVSIYKPCDIRGHGAEELTPELYRRWGHALGMQVEPRAKFVVGGDIRDSTPALMAALVEGLSTAGVDVVEVGQLPTPMVYHARRRLAAGGCAIVTASHNAAEINGLKWAIDGLPPTPDEVQSLRLAAEQPIAARPGRPNSVSRPLDVTFDYVAFLQETWANSLSAHLHVVIDPLHGCWVNRVRRYLHAVFPQCLFSTIHDRADATFAGRVPDCSLPENLVDLQEAVYRERADLGIAFDGDGDRVTFVDDQGMVLTAEEATWVLLQSFGGKLQGRPFVYDLKFSDCIPRAAEMLQAQPVVQRCGHAFIRTRMRETDAVFGAEISGHYFFGELGGGDDGLMAACRMIAHLARSPRALAEISRECPDVFMTPDLRVSLGLDRQRQVIEQIERVWSDHPRTTIDGIRVETPAGWALARPSVTESALTFRFESVDWPGLEHLVSHFCERLGDVGDQLWARYKRSTGRCELG